MADITTDMKNSGEENPLSQGICAAIESRLQAHLDSDQSASSYKKRRLADIGNPKYASIYKDPDMTDTITVAAIGPYHRPAPAQQQPIITDAKKSSIVKFLKEHQRLDINEFICWVLREEKRARGYYEEDSLGHIHNSIDFVEMLLLDGCLVLFAIFLLRPSAHIDGSAAKMATDTKLKDEFFHISADISFNRKQLKLELLMLDNQIPFFVVEHLYTKLRASLFRGVAAGTIVKIALSCFDDIHPRCNYNLQVIPEEKHHLLHLFHWSRSPSGKYKVGVTDFLTNEPPKSHLPSATELSESAIICRKKPSGSSLDLSFHCEMFGMYGKMDIPALYLYDQSEVIFRNLVAFEQSHLRCGISVTAFCICMARLLQSETDAKLLRKNRILAHTTKTDKEIVDFFKKLSGEYKETSIPKDLHTLYKNVATYHESPQGRFIVETKLKYFSSPLITISVILGAIAFIATVGNSIHSV